MDSFDEGKQQRGFFQLLFPRSMVKHRFGNVHVKIKALPFYEW